jgi:Tfp pilus assembly PilM family ATPase
MTDTRRIISLDLGSQTIGLAQFQVQPSGVLALQKYARRDFLAEPAGEDVRRPEMARVLRQIVDELQIKRGHVNYSVTGQSVFVRFVKLPSLDEEKVERIIAFEAQQEVPFPIGEVVWDYQLIGGGCDEQIQVVLVAIKANLLDVPVQLRRLERLLIAGQHRGAHEQSSLRRAGKIFLAYYSNRWRLDYGGHCQGVR